MNARMPGEASPSVGNRAAVVTLPALSVTPIEMRHQSSFISEHAPRQSGNSAVFHLDCLKFGISSAMTMLKGSKPSWVLSGSTACRSTSRPGRGSRAPFPQAEHEPRDWEAPRYSDRLSRTIGCCRSADLITDTSIRISVSQKT